MFRRPRLGRVGLYLGVQPGAGGMFQYALSILDAVASLPAETFAGSALYEDPLWESCLEAYPAMKRIRVRAFASTAAAQALLLLPRPVGRRLSASHPAIRAMRRAGQDLWIFPAQDVLAVHAGVPAIVSVHDLMHRYERRFREGAAPGRYFLRERRFGGIARTAKAMLVDSTVGKTQLVESYDADPRRVFVLPYIPPAYLSQPPPPGFEARYRLPSKFAFYPAQFWPHKNHRRLLAALQGLREDIPDVHLVLAGAKDRGYAALAAYCAQAALGGHVSFVGRVPDSDMAEFYRRARCLVMPTFFGPTNIPPLEAFALGCPVAASGIYGMPEQIGDAGLLFDPHSEREIAESLRRLWSDDALCERLRRKGLERAARWNRQAFNARLQSIVGRVLECA